MRSNMTNSIPHENPNSLFFAGEFAWRMWRSGWNAADIVQATSEWKRNHPERFKKWLKRNGLSED